MSKKPEPKRAARLEIRIARADKRAIEAVAMARGVSVSVILREAVRTATKTSVHE
jgi:uncharacterized protein (DUF1778 family)